MQQHKVLKEFINSLVVGDNTCLIIKGDAGIGKSSTILETLHELGYENKKHFIYLNNYSAPRSFYEFILKSTYLQEPQLVILDDVEELLKQSKIVSILRSCLWAVDGKRICNWVSGSKVGHFEFRGKIVIILNKFDESVGLLSALRDRSLYYNMEFSQEEIKVLIVAKAHSKPYKALSEEERVEVAEYIINNVRGQKLSLRDLPKTLDLRVGSPENWKLLFNKQYEN
jgi:hypothetical protein